MLVLGFLVGGSSIADAASKYKWEKYFTKDQGKTIQSLVGKSIRGNLSDGDGDWKEVVSGKAIKDGAINTNKIKDGTIVNADISSGAAIMSSKINFLGNDLNVGGSKSMSAGGIGLLSASSSDSMTMTYEEDDELADIVHFDFSDGVSSGFNFQFDGGGSFGGSVDMESLFVEGSNPFINFDDTSAVIYTEASSSAFGADNATIKISDVLRLNPISAPTFACNTNTRGSIYYDLDDDKVKACNGTAWTDLY